VLHLWYRIINPIAPSLRRQYLHLGPTCLHPLKPIFKPGLDSCLIAATQCQTFYPTARVRAKRIPMRATSQHCLTLPSQTVKPSCHSQGKAFIDVGPSMLMYQANALLYTLPVYLYQLLWIHQTLAGPCKAQKTLVCICQTCWVEQCFECPIKFMRSERWDLFLVFYTTYTKGGNSPKTPTQGY
jgi:hypothetical protein